MRTGVLTRERRGFSRTGRTMAGCVAAALVMTWSMLAGAQPIDGVFVHVRDSDGTVPKQHATVTLTFQAGALRMAAVQPGETVTDTGTYSVHNRLITIRFREMEWEATRQPFDLTGCILTLPFKALGGSPGPGTSVWRRQSAECAGAGPADGFTPFSADEIVTVGSEQTRARIFVTERAIRAEGNGRVTIVRFDRDVMWLLSIPDRTYTERPLGYGGRASLARERSTPRSCRVVGEDQVSGYAAVKEVCRILPNQTETRWSAKALGGIEIRQVSADQTMALENIKPMPLAPALFEIPPGFRKENL